MSLDWGRATHPWHIGSPTCYHTYIVQVMQPLCIQSSGLRADLHKRLIASYPGSQGPLNDVQDGGQDRLGQKSLAIGSGIPRAARQCLSWMLHLNLSSDCMR